MLEAARAMPHGLFNYLPLSPVWFGVLAGVFVALIALIEVGVLQLVYMRLGIGRRAATLLLLASLLGSYVNIPLFQLSHERVLSNQYVVAYGMVYVVPQVVDWPGTIVAINLGGAVIPCALSLYLLFRHRIWGRGVLALLGVAAVSHMLARPVPGVGIAVPMLLPPLAATIIALLLSRRYAAPLAYVGGSMGTLLGADLLNLNKISGLGAPVASIGGAGTFDGVFITGIIAVLIASLGARGPVEPARGPWDR
jgi:uncharacterized membrane protein